MRYTYLQTFFILGCIYYVSTFVPDPADVLKFKQTEKLIHRCFVFINIGKHILCADESLRKDYVATLLYYFESFMEDEENKTEKLQHYFSVLACDGYIDRIDCLFSAGRCFKGFLMHIKENPQIIPNKVLKLATEESFVKFRNDRCSTSSMVSFRGLMTDSELNEANEITNDSDVQPTQVSPHDDPLPE
ncbi:uncharacterized protein LOC126903556 [Daktulosphaira vitifoliae]|uniref:uncharacterized protein LOC126903556 n=1 Tax=Daktulosphaira vitifoliae TaxID=58002 RepID=UPI0021A98A26|nr:uncharacterized protein LOC126903556 [Daktulosphaira vitifoliae]